MTNAEKQVLSDIINGLDNLAVAIDSMESALIHKGLLRKDEVQFYSPHHVHTVAQKLSGLRLALESLPLNGRSL